MAYRERHAVEMAEAAARWAQTGLTEIHDNHPLPKNLQKAIRSACDSLKVVSGLASTIQSEMAAAWPKGVQGRFYDHIGHPGFR